MFWWFFIYCFYLMRYGKYKCLNEHIYNTSFRGIFFNFLKTKPVLFHITSFPLLPFRIKAPQRLVRHLRRF